MIELCCEEADIATSSGGLREGINNERGKGEVGELCCAIQFQHCSASLVSWKREGRRDIVPVTIIIITQVFSI